MDLWVVAAAAGAGYIAKNLQNLSVDKKDSFSYNVQSGSRNFLQQLRDKTCPLRRLARKTAQDDADFDFSEVNPLLSNRNQEAGLASISSDALEEKRLDFEDGKNRNFIRGNRNKFAGNRKCCVHSVRPLSSLEHEKMEDNTSLYPSVSRVGPVLVTDASRIMSKSVSYSSFSELESCRDEARRENGVGLKVNNTMLRSSSLEQFGSVEGLRKMEKCSKNLELSGSSSQGPETMLLFITGMTVGILSATTAWKIEVDKLNKQLNQAENLVQDLHEELDMKEMLMVKDLTDNTPLSIEEPIASPSGVEVNKLNKFDGRNENNDKYTENLELLSKIEAELQAELEMLENNMKASAPERVSDAVELDPDFDPDIVQGELNSTLVNGASESENETPDTTTDCSKPSNYAVSPWELSFRLHELIESRLQTRIKELETALANSENSNQVLSSQSIVSERKFSSAKTESSSIFVSDEDYASEDEGTDELDMFLIQQIVERRKSGSSFNLEID
ncbi:hypothetical protein DH2020_032306 [Rehmannia glutinosa]|uniref:Uncharacterized protein n=1 Tax=Rehmannia glutinosa TaxID=99300 RepID=A0ABR0VFM8_REHGL